ncbi:branched-chain amino acid aminotransferase [Galbibacter sp. EGI 63066]|uniref:branched-chain amino acid aminotransferase n=1 Tax=Galbibacter sp. EGI 63066 TaxID=2993559 RepID=UPI002248A977|nr:branched-chain amino acid aminotransferase [Galbibacter sp. EGI 63066]MCX2678558.1 branched-chain amino acid aminotransferase [Galbibacter sp. EGI 63066]
MGKETATYIEIEKRQTSKINDVDFSNLAFGSVFTDHMFVCDYVDGEWKTPKIIPYQPISLDPSARVFHYGQAVFEGMKAYKDENDDIWLFRPEENFNRINKSSERLAMPEFPKDYFFEGLTTLLNLDKEWIQKGIGNSLYIRPFAIATEYGVSASPSNKYRFMIICSPAQSYYGGEVRVKIADHYSRAASGGFGYAKAAGNYAGQFYPTNLAQKEGFQQIIWTDASTHEYLEEAGTMNIFFRIGDTLVTCPISDRILDGVTRKSVITVAEDMGINVEVRPIKVQEILDAYKNGELKEIFGSGTAAVINPILGFGYKGDKWELPKVDDDSYSSKIKQTIIDIQYNLAEDKHGWRYKV